MATSNLIVKVTADTKQFRRDIKRVSRWAHWRFLMPALIAGVIGGIVGGVLARVFA